MKKENNSASVDEFMSKLDHPLKAEIEAVREIIVKANSKISERIKWNAPSFYYKEDMAAFYPRATKYVHLVFVFPQGLIKDSSGLLEGDYPDRRMAYFYDMKDVKAKSKVLKKIVNDWIKLVDKE